MKAIADQNPDVIQMIGFVFEDRKYCEKSKECWLL